MTTCLANITLYDYARLKYYENKYTELINKLNWIIAGEDQHIDDKKMATKVLDELA